MTPEDNVQPIEPSAPPPSGVAPRMASFLSNVMSTRLDKSGSRLKLIALAFIAVFLTIDGKLIMLGIAPESSRGLKQAATEALSSARPDILDRNGEILATDIKTMSVFAEPRRIIDKDEAVELLTAVLPDVDAKDLRTRIGSRKGFVWVKRGITPQQQQEVYRLGLPGVGFLPENKRIYPNGPLAAHVLGFTNLDNQGIAGIEKYIDGQGLADLHGAGFNLTPQDLKPVSLSIDLKATQGLRDELAKGVEHFKAKSGAAAIMDVNTGEVVAFASLPDYDPNNPVDALDPNHINHLTVGTYEMGSTFKAISIAMALEANKVTLRTSIDARDNLRYGRFTIHDFPRHAPHADGARSVRPLVEHRHGPHGHDGGRRRPQGVPAQNGSARPSAHGTARECHADRATELERVEHDHDRVRTRPQRGAAAGHDGRGRPRQRRPHAHPHLPETGFG